MRIRSLAVTAVVACALGWVGRSVFSEDAPAKPDQAAEMAEMMKNMVPGEEHARLIKAFAGEWDVKSKFTSGGQAMEGTATAKYDSILGGRFLREQINGMSPMGPFDAFALRGYNNGTKQYVNTWVDSMGTGIMTGTGVENEKGKCYSFTSTYEYGMGKVITVKETVKFASDDEFTVTMDMGEHGTGELVAKRKK